jgi:hypothetical protein
MKHKADKDLRNISRGDVEDIVVRIKKSAYYKDYNEETDA